MPEIGSLALGNAEATPARRRPITNGDAPWDAFDSEDYYGRNYDHLLSEDHRIIEVVTAFFREAVPGVPVRRAIDVGAGANLYPALTMLPYARKIHLVERAQSNREWLAHELNDPHDSWKQFWKTMTSGGAAYDDLGEDPFPVLRKRARVREGSIFSLRRRRFHLGTMFFVAESITTRREEFRQATRGFLRSLKRGAPFAAAFMRESTGYTVAGQHFPACAVTENDVAECLAQSARIKDIQSVKSLDLREGYSGMIVALGWKR